MIVKQKPYFSPKIKFRRMMLRRLMTGKLVHGIYIIRFADEPDELEIIRSDYMIQKSLRTEDKLIVAFTKTYEEAIDYLVDITQKSIDKFGEPRLRQYLR